MQRRKVSFKLYPNAAQAAKLDAWTRLHCELYNAALQERISAWQRAGKSISYYDQQNALPQIKADRPEFIALGSHALQQTLRRLDLAFQAFFRRHKAGKAPGFPRFKAASRFAGFTYPDPAGWKLLANGPRAATLKVGSGVSAMHLRARGRHRFGDTAVANDLTFTRRHGQWFASVTLRVPEAACSRTRCGDAVRGVDFGLTDWATFDDGQTIANPRWVRQALPQLAALQRQRAKKKMGSLRWRRLGRQIARTHERIANLRRDFVHQETARMVRGCAVLATEELAPANMSRSARGTQDAPGRRVRQNAGLNREILSAAFSSALQALSYKAAEAGTRLHLAPTLTLKPSQRCSACWELVPKLLSQRQHVCPHCGHTAQRDQNSAAVVLIDALSVDAAPGPIGPNDQAPGTGAAARPGPLPSQPSRPGKSKPMTRETPTTTPSGV